MLEEAEGWYEHIAASIEELRDDLRRMESVNATPRDFGLRVRSHPDTLIVTARNKMGSGRHHRVSVGLANRFIETAVLRRDEESLAVNRRAAVILAKNLRRLGKAPENGESDHGGRLVRNAPSSVVTDFLSAFRNHSGSFLTDPEPVKSYIDARSRGELRDWDILFAGVKKLPRKGFLTDRSLGFDLYCQRRSPGKRSDRQTLLITNKQRVASRGIEKCGLTEDQVRTAKENYRREKREKQLDTVNYPDRIFRNVRTRPLLIVHLLAIGREDDDLSRTNPVVAWSMSFPETDYEEEKVEYVVNPTWFREHYRHEGEEETADDEG